MHEHRVSIDILDDVLNALNNRGIEFETKDVRGSMDTKVIVGAVDGYELDEIVSNIASMKTPKKSKTEKLYQEMFS